MKRISYSESSNVAITQVFDRYGQLIAEIDISSKEWDENHKGASVPSSDYWFIGTSLTNQKHQGHFALKI